jgi:hypothetical protein
MIRTSLLLAALSMVTGAIFHQTGHMSPLLFFVLTPIWMLFAIPMAELFSGFKKGSLTKRELTVILLLSLSSAYLLIRLGGYGSACHDTIAIPAVCISLSSSLVLLICESSNLNAWKLSACIRLFLEHLWLVFRRRRYFLVCVASFALGLIYAAFQ